MWADGVIPSANDRLDEVALMQLAHAYIERKKWEAEVQAAMVARALFGDGSDSSGSPSPSSGGGQPGEYQRVAPGQMLGMMGATWE